jgi:hypothetical protein
MNQICTPKGGKKMKRKWIIVAMLFVIPAMLFSVSCAKKSVVAEPSHDRYDGRR